MAANALRSTPTPLCAPRRLPSGTPVPAARPRRTTQRPPVLEVLHRDARAQEYFVVAGYGHGADWLRNVRAAQHVRIHIAREEHAATWRLVKEDEALAIFTAYERRYRVAAPALRLVLSRLLGWRYDGSPAARDRLVREMPMMAFRPVDEA